MIINLGAGGASAADKVKYDNSTSNLSSDNVQGAIDEVTSKVGSIETNVGNKVDKVSGKGLSTNDYTTTEKNKLSGIATGATKNVIDSSLSTSSTNAVQNKVVTAKLNTLTSNLGGLRFGKDGDGNYGYYGADDSLIPFKNRTSLPWLKNVPDDDSYFLAYTNGAGASYYLIDTNGYSNLHVEHYANNKANNIRIYDGFNQTNQIGTISIDGGTFDVSDRNDVIYLRIWGNSYAVYKIYVT